MEWEEGTVGWVVVGVHIANIYYSIQLNILYKYILYKYMLYTYDINICRALEIMLMNKGYI